MACASSTYCQCCYKAGISNCQGSWFNDFFSLLQSATRWQAKTLWYLIPFVIRSGASGYNDFLGQKRIPLKWDWVTYYRRFLWKCPLHLHFFTESEEQSGMLITKTKERFLFACPRCYFFFFFLERGFRKQDHWILIHVGRKVGSVYCLTPHTLFCINCDF